MATYVVSSARFITMKDGKRTVHKQGRELELTGDEANQAVASGFVAPVEPEAAVEEEEETTPPPPPPATGAGSRGRQG